MRRRSLIGALAAAAALAAVLAGAQTGGGAAAPANGPLAARIQENQTELERLQSELQNSRQRIAKLEDQEAATRRDQTSILDEIELTRRLLAEMEERERMLGERSVELQTALADSRRVYESRRTALARSLRSMYVRGTIDDLQMVLTADSFADFLARAKWDAMLARLGAGLVEGTREDAGRIHREQRQLAASLAEIWETREQAAQEQGRLQELEAEQIAVLRDLEKQRQGVKNRMLELSLNEQRLTYILSDLEQQRTDQVAKTDVGASSLAQQAGQLEWPVRGEILRGFGRSVHPRFKTVTLNNGVNIAAATGAPVAAVADGTVEYSDQLPGFGRCVILDHGAGYYTLYAHLDRVFVAAEAAIARGQVIAEVGRPSGEEQPQLYFEVRHGRTPLDPAEWLRPR